MFSLRVVTVSDEPSARTRIRDAALKRFGRDVRLTEHPRTRAAIYVTWLLAPLAFDEHVARVLGVEDLHDIDVTLRFSGW